MDLGGILGILVLIADIYAIVRIANSSADWLGKLIWILVVIVLPVIGLLIWYLRGPNHYRNPNHFQA